MDQRIKIVSGIALTMGAFYLVSLYREHAQNQRQIEYSTSVVRDIPAMPFAKGRALTADEKQNALDLLVGNNRMLLAAGLLNGDFDKENFSKAYFATLNPGLEAPKDTFEKRDRARRTLTEGAAGYTKAKAEWVKKTAELAVLPVRLSFMNYRFDSQAFGVKTAAVMNVPNDSAFGVSVFRDTPEPTKIRGTGSSTLERAASSYNAYQVTDRLWPVPETTAKSVDTQEFRVFAKGYFDTARSYTDGRMTLLHCVQIDLFADEQLTTPLGSQGCASLNISRKGF